MLKIHTNRSDKEKFDPYELYILVQHPIYNVF